MQATHLVGVVYIYKQTKVTAITLAALGFIVFILAYPIGILSQMFSAAAHNQPGTQFNTSLLFKDLFVLLTSGWFWLLFCGFYAYVGYIIATVLPRVCAQLRPRGYSEAAWSRQLILWGNILVLGGISTGFVFSVWRVTVMIIRK